jgi:RimJ/RimL family protein N-acetyltransferase
VEAPPVVVARTRRLVLRHFELTDLDGVARLLDDPEVMRFSVGRKSREESLRWIERCREDYKPENHGFGHYAVVRDEGSEFLGFCGLTRFDDIGGKPEVEVGYRFAPEHWGQGFATEAAGAVRNLGFHRHGLTRLISLIEPANVRSIRVAEKIGMSFEKEIFKWERRVRVYSVSRDDGAPSDRGDAV